jgi:hypothetical protein
MIGLIQGITNRWDLGIRDIGLPDGTYPGLANFDHVSGCFSREISFQFSVVCGVVNFQNLQLDCNTSPYDLIVGDYNLRVFLNGEEYDFMYYARVYSKPFF